MAPSRKTPLNSSAATLGDVHPSPATWVIIEGYPNGKYAVAGIGQFLTAFRITDMLFGRDLAATFRNSYRTTRDPAKHTYPRMAYDLGLIPVETRSQFHPHPGWVEDPSESGTYWSERFVVKLQRAHIAVGCTPEEFRQQYLVRYIEERCGGIVDISDPYYRYNYGHFLQGMTL